MGTNSLINYSSTPVAQSVAARFDQYFNSWVVDVVPRNSSGVPQASAGKMGTTTYPWAEVNADALNINGTPFDPNNLSTESNQIGSGATRTGSEQPLFLQADGSTNALTILAASTNLVLTVASAAVTFTTDVSVSSLTVAPSTNNTCLINNSNFTDQEFTKYVTIIDYDTAGSEIIALDGKVAAFSVGATEYFFAKVDDTNSQLIVERRGFFFDSSNNPVERVTLADNDTITLLQAAWIYADDSGSSASVGYTVPTYSGAEPSSVVTNDYWFDSANELWKRYDGASFQTVNRMLIGYAVIDSSNCVATRCVDFTKSFDDTNTLTIEKASDSTAQSVGDFESEISVYGNKLYFNGLITWDMATDLESGVSEANSTAYYFYIANTGEVKISDEAPIYNVTAKGGYHPFHTWRFIARILNDGSGDLETQAIHYRGDEKIVIESDDFFINPNGVQWADIYAIGGGASGNGGTPTAGASTIFNFDMTAAGGITGGGASSGSSGDLVYESTAATGIPDAVFRHVIQLSVVGLTSGTADGVGYGDGGYNSGVVGGGGGSAYKRYNLKNINYGCNIDIGAGGDNPAGTVDGADGVLIIQL